MLFVTNVILLKQFQPLISLGNYALLSVVLTIVIILIFELKEKSIYKPVIKIAESKAGKNLGNTNIMGENKDTVFFQTLENEKTVFEPKIEQNENNISIKSNEIVEERQLVKSSSGFHVDGELPNLDNLTDEDFDIIIFEDEIEDDFYEKQSLDILEIKNKFESGETLSTDEQTIIDAFFKTEEQWNESGEIIIQTTANNDSDFEPKPNSIIGECNIDNTIVTNPFDQKPQLSNSDVQNGKNYESKSIFEEYIK